MARKARTTRNGTNIMNNASFTKISISINLLGNIRNIIMNLFHTKLITYSNNNDNSCKMYIADHQGSTDNGNRISESI